MKLLLHTCCGPCAIVPLRGFRAEGAEVFGFFGNPNIHPFTEWERRRDALGALAEAEGLRLLPDAAYDPLEWLRAVAFREGERCRICYHVRLRHTAHLARRGRFGAFSTTLLYSKFQRHELIREIGEAVASEIGVRFLYRDWRVGWDEGVQASRALGLYRQQYCGCLLSEQERFAPPAKRRSP
ncbi:MAG: epoxyqueuosine reductase QueH [Deltaproteobacteria bacterium]|nr:epoxyqueuosine reductase QueH [Deltaproteobacteria bacterium]